MYGKKQFYHDSSINGKEHALYDEVRQRYQSNCCEKGKSNHYYFVQQTQYSIDININIISV